MSKHKTINGNTMTTTLGGISGNFMPSLTVELPRLKTIGVFHTQHVVPGSGRYQDEMMKTMSHQEMAREINPVCFKCPHAEKLIEKLYRVDRNVEEFRTSIRCKLLRLSPNVICPDEGIKSADQFFYDEFPSRVSKAPQIQRHPDEPTNKTAGDW